MAIYKKAMVNQSAVDAAVERVTKALAPDVVRVRFNFDEDWLGNDAIFFRVIISDESSRNRLRETTKRAEAAILKAVEPYNLDLYPYFEFRNVSEQADLREEIWA